LLQSLQFTEIFINFENHHKNTRQRLPLLWKMWKTLVSLMFRCGYLDTKAFIMHKTCFFLMFGFIQNIENQIEHPLSSGLIHSS